MGLLDFLFPKYCVNCRKIGSYICPDCFSLLSFNEYSVCLACNKPSIDGLTHPKCRGKYVIDGAFSSISYKGIVKKLVYQFKYKPNLSDLKTVLVDLFHEGLIQKEMFAKILEKEDLILVPIPLYSGKFRKRGYNQAEILASGLSSRLGIPLVKVLERIKNTKTQVGLKKEERKENIKGAFEISKSQDSGQARMTEKGILDQVQYDVKEFSVLLVDDVLTTGSTLMEAAKVLKRGGVKKVWGITLARD